MFALYAAVTKGFNMGIIQSMIEKPQNEKGPETTGRAQRIAQAIDLIKKAGTSQKQIAADLNVSPQAVNNWKRTGKASVDALVYLSEVSGISLEYLRYGHQKTPGSPKTIEEKHSPYKNIAKPRQPNFVPVKSFVQIINNDNGSLREMKYWGEVTDDSFFYQVDTDLMEGDQGERIPRGSVLHLVKVHAPSADDVALYSVNESPVLGHYSEVAGVPYLRPSNRQYHSINVENGELIGVAVEITITKQLKDLRHINQGASTPPHGKD